MEQAKQVVAAAKVLERELNEVYAKALGREAFRRNDTVYTAGASGSRKCKDPEGFVEWLEMLEDVSDVAAMFNPNNTKITALRAVAEKHGYEAKKVEDKYFKWTPAEDTTPVVSAVPISKALVWQRGLTEGEHRAN